MTSAQTDIDSVVASVERPLRRPRRAERTPEIAVLGVSLGLNLANLGANGTGNEYYAAAVRSMSDSWHNFAYATVDPGGWITVDKPPLAAWVQALSVRTFGYSGWAMLAPMAVAGAVAVGLLMWLVGRSWGRAAGLVAGFCLAVTPIAVAVSRSNNPDGILVLTVVAAAAALVKAVETGRSRWLVVLGLLIGFAFLAKMLAGLIVAPAIWAGYLVAGKHTWKVRIAQLVGALGVVVAIAGGWVLAVDHNPIGQRPYIGGSTDGSAADLVFGYNGFGRIDGGNGANGGAPLGLSKLIGGGIDQFGGSPGVARLFNAGMGDQVMWDAPLAAVAALGGLGMAVRFRRRDLSTAVLVALSGWAATVYLVFSDAHGMFHNYYVSLLAPALAGLIGIGTAMTARGGRLSRAVAAASLATTAVVQVVFLDRVDALRPLRSLVPVLIMGGAALLAASGWRRLSQRSFIATLSAAVAVASVAPAVWAASGDSYAANGSFPDARPQSPSNNGFSVASLAGLDGGTLSGHARAWLAVRQGHARWMVAVASAAQADPEIIAGYSVMPIGGFIGTDPAMTTSRLASLVDSGKLRYVLGGGAVSAVVASACRIVPAADWNGTSSTSVQLYDCAGRADEIRATTAAVASPSSGGGLPGAGVPGAGLPGGAPGGPGGSRTPPPGLDQHAIEACVQKHGVSLAGGGGPPNPETPGLQQALSACLGQSLP